MSNENMEELVYDAVIELFDLSSYSSTIENGYWTSHKEFEHVLPSVEFGDIWHYLVYRNNFYTAGNGNVLAQAKVHHSMAFNLPPLRPCVAFNSAGGVITAHCDCIAGLGECCSHVGAILFGAQAVDLYSYSSIGLKTGQKNISTTTISLILRHPCKNFLTKIENFRKVFFTEYFKRIRKTLISLSFAGLDSLLPGNRKNILFSLHPFFIAIVNDIWRSLCGI
ncbi:Uncharacterized protein APZ42_010704 [Daphnia magna]|uniref:SWIM-type domain-containing protein n=1 Tax=Daphnia magna TaxID=35525 RepID=A0A164D9B4_9CRUS|nr:Uncharacterized protein APZ42_010704 [Daphnia magna]